MTRITAVLLLLTPFAAAQVPREVVPLEQGPPSSLEGGQLVSQPITAVQPETQLPPQTSPPPQPFPTRSAQEHPIAPRRSHWLSLDYMMQWTQGVTLPTLATGNMFNRPVLGESGTVALLGGRQSRGSLEGMRIVSGNWHGDHSVWGHEIAYHFLGSNTDRQVMSGGGLGGEALLGRPLFNARTGREDVVMISHPNMLGELAVSQTLRVTGWEVTLLRELFANEWARVSALGGYRYFQVHDGLRIDQQSEYLGPPVVGTGVASYRSATADQIDAHNRFHGGTLGLRSQLDYGGFFAQLDTKVSLGRSTGIMRISGQTVATIDSPGGTTISYFPNGVFGQPSNSGRSVRAKFAVLPEANLRFGVAFTETARLFVGYQFSYLTEVVRAADQLDRGVDLGQSPGDSFNRPRLPFSRTDFWVQGVTLGLEWRY